MQPYETDNGRTGAPHSAKRHSTCTDEDDEDDEDDGDEGEDGHPLVSLRESLLWFFVRRENRGGAEGGANTCGNVEIELYICMPERSL